MNLFSSSSRLCAILTTPTDATRAVATAARDGVRTALEDVFAVGVTVHEVMVFIIRDDLTSFPFDLPHVRVGADLVVLAAPYDAVMRQGGKLSPFLADVSPIVGVPCVVMDGPSHELFVGHLRDVGLEYAIEAQEGHPAHGALEEFIDRIAPTARARMAEESRRRRVALHDLVGVAFARSSADSTDIMPLPEIGTDVYMELRIYDRRRLPVPPGPTSQQIDAKLKELPPDGSFWLVVNAFGLTAVCDVELVPTVGATPSTN